MTDDAAWNRRAAITAYHAAPEAKPAQVGVKPLEWSTTGDWRWTETTGRYTINENRGQWFLYGAANPALHGPYNDYEDAMAAAQSDSAAARCPQIQSAVYLSAPKALRAGKAMIPLRWYFRQPRDVRFVIRLGLLAAVLAIAGIGVSVGSALMRLLVP